MKEALREIYDLVGIAESQLQIKSVLATRSKNVMQIECDRKKVFPSKNLSVTAK